MIIVARLLCGAGGGSFAIAMAYVSHAVTAEQRTKVCFTCAITRNLHASQAMSLINAISNVGLIGGPAVTIVISGYSWHWGALDFTPYTLPAWLMFLLFVVDLVLTAIFLREPRAAMVGAAMGRREALKIWREGKAGGRRDGVCQASHFTASCPG